MRIQFDDGTTWWVDGDTLPPNLPVEQLRTRLVPCDLHEARQRLAELQEQRQALPTLSDADLIAWARMAHPTTATAHLLEQQIAQQQAIIDEYSA